jgi:hypothetical protein
LRDAPYHVLRDWAQMYGGNLLVVLPDCFGTTSFLARAPDWVADWKGARPDSKSPLDAARELIAWWRARGRDPHDKLIVLSDAMDVDSIESAARALRGAVNLSIGWGTNLTNDFKDCADLAGLQGRRGGRAAGGQAVRQPEQGDGAAGRNRALHQSIRRGGHGPEPGHGLIPVRRRLACLIKRREVFPLTPLRRYVASERARL